MSKHGIRKMHLTRRPRCSMLVAVAFAFLFCQPSLSFAPSTLAVVRGSSATRALNAPLFVLSEDVGVWKILIEQAEPQKKEEAEKLATKIVEELKGTKDAVIQAKDAAIQKQKEDKDAEIQAKDAVIQAKDATIQAKDATIQKQSEYIDTVIQAQSEYIETLKEDKL